MADRCGDNVIIYIIVLRKSLKGESGQTKLNFDDFIKWINTSLEGIGHKFGNGISISVQTYGTSSGKNYWP